MPSIYLGKQSGTYYTQLIRGVTVTVSGESYDKSNLFKKYTHKLQSASGGNIWVFNKTWAVYFAWDGYATLQPGTEYQNSKLQSADVYFNRFDTVKPLVLVLHFKKEQEEQVEGAANGESGSNGQSQKPDDKYWKYSEFNGMIGAYGKKEISSLKKFDNDKSLLQELIKENDETNKSLTYELTEKDNGSRGTEYRNNKISVTGRQNVNGGGTGKFYKYRHSPKSPPIVRKSFVLYNNHVLMKSSSAPVGGIQGQHYSSITVYFSNTDNKALLIQLDNAGQKTYLKRVIGGGDTFFWAVDKQAESAIGTGGGDHTQVTNHLEQIVISLDNKIYVILNEQKPYAKSDLEGLKGPDGKTVKLSKYQPENIAVLPEDLKVIGDGEQSTSKYKYYKHSITVDDKALSDVPQEVKRQAEFELVPSIPNVTIQMFDGSVGKGTRAKLTFKQNGQGKGSSELKTNLHVYFYNHTGGDSGTGDTPDKVPLMLEHKGEFYGPSGVSSYFTGWERISSISDDDTSGIGNELDRVNKALNEVNINQTSSYGLPDPPSGKDQLNGFKTERVTVKCEKVGGTGGTSGSPCSTSPPDAPGTPETCTTTSVYIKYTHKTVNKFQLGKIKYQGHVVKVVGEDGGRDGTAITVKPGYNELTAYYLTSDMDRNYPLLIKIGKQDGGASQLGDMYYKLKTTGTKPEQYMWEQDRGARSKVKGNGAQLVKYLNGINYQVKKVLKIELQHNTAAPYPANWSSRPGQTSGFEQVRATGVGTSNGKQIQVEDCTAQCLTLTGRGYKCFKHQLTGLGDKLNEIGGIALTLPGQSGKDIEIKLHNGGEKCQNGSPDTQIPQLFYNKCMGDIYVYFYDSKSAGGVKPSKTDTVPLMLWYNKNYYKPENRDNYFSKWVCVNGIDGASKEPCGSDQVSKLANQLDEVNRALNVIELDPEKASGPSYGLPTTGAGANVDTRSFSTERVKVTDLKPKSPYASSAYTRVVHRTTNGFEIGDIKYSGQDITRHGVNAGIGASIMLKRENGNGNHKSLVNTHNWNTVVAYYSTSDRDKVLPQLIVILKTDNPINGQDVKGSGNSYGYYILSTKSGSDYEYKWVEVKDVPPKGVTLNDATDFTLFNSVVILLEKQNGGYNGEGEIKKAIESAKLNSPGQSDGDINRITINNKNIKVTDATQREGKCVQTYGYKLFTHNFSSMTSPPPAVGVSLILGIRLLIPCGTRDGATQYKQLQLCKDPSTSDIGSGTGQHYLYYNRGSNNVYVYFYDKDPRPLLVFYDKSAYKPNGTREYDSKWVNEMSIRQCDCTGRGGKDLLEALTQVVGFLNKVNLFNRPGGKDCNGGPSAPSPTTCTNGTDGSNTCTYTVHTYKGKPINVKVTCSKVEGSKGPTSTQGCYYMSMTHTPAGMENGPGGSAGNGAPGYRLGTVEYQGEGSAISGGNRVNYTVGGTNKWNPLLKVTTYYYSEDTGFTKPLLVVLEFKTKGPPGPPPPGPNGTATEVKEYYKLTNSGGSRLSWTLDRNAESKVKGAEGREVDNNKLVEYLNEIRFGLMKVVRIMISSTSGYQFKTQDGTARDNRFSAPNGDGGGKQIQVQECTGCTALVRKGYKCFQHKVTEAIKDKEDEVGGIKLTVPGSNGDVEIPLHKKREGAGGNNGEAQAAQYEQIKPLTYNKCMGDIYVFFYQGKGDKNPDTVPLMLVYNNKFYKPKTRDEYFKKWIPVDGLKDVKPGKECGKEPEGAQKLAKQLDDVNRELNRIELDPGKAGGTGYGLPSEGGGGVKPHPTLFPTERVIVTTKEPGTSASKTYTRIVHRTKNGFTVGKLTSNSGKDITSDGFQVTGKSGSEATIKVNGGRTSNHTVYTNTNKLNTVVVYYAKNDVGYKLPQLMVLLHTDKAIESGQGAITGSTTEKKYGYYIIAEENELGENYQYKWRKVEVTESTPVTLDDKTDFSLLNSVVILLEQRGTSDTSSTSYGDSQIKGAIGTAINNKSVAGSPGNTGDVNRIQGKDITITLTGESGGATTLKGTGFKCWTHDISALVTLNRSLRDTLPRVTLIGGLRFLIPTALGKGRYIQLKIKNGESDVCGNNDTGLLFYHQKGENKVCVFFYESDPRPLLVCYNKQTFKPKSKDCYFCKWVKESTVNSCKCEDDRGDGKEILKKLVEISNFLNPVNIKVVPRIGRTCTYYYVHLFNGKVLRIKVEKTVSSDSGFCYDKYTHVHYGACNESTRSSGTGFRLGNIMYKDQCIQADGGGTSNDQCITAVVETSKYTPSPEVVTYYYRGDSNHKNPLLVGLKNNYLGNISTLYFELQRDTTNKGNKKYKRFNSPPIVLDTSSYQLAKKLDKILYDISQKLQVILDQRPLPRWYSSTKKDSTVCKGEHEDLQSLRNEKQEFLKSIEEQYKNDNKPRPDYFFYHIPMKTCYKAQLYGTDGQPVSNGSNTTHVVVEEVRNCKELALRGYRCYKHKLTEVSGIEEVGGLKLYLWKEQGAKTTENGGHQIKLCNGTSGSKKNGPTSDVTYNTCKGNLYVYFYGEDPRPLMLCYDGNAYKPENKGSYEVKWVCVPKVSKCQCDDKFEATQVLKELYELSMELNEVQLGETKSAYEPETRGTKSYKYPVHKYNKTPVNVMVTGTDLSCYKQYTHRPEKGGYRLGRICYNPESSSSAPEPTGNGDCKEECKKANGITYTESKQLISVSLYYYMYDKEHKWPLIVELGYKGELSDFFRLCSTGSEGAGSTQIKWEKMVEDASKVENGKHSCKNGAEGPQGKNGAPGENGQTEERKNTCDLDEEFAKQAAELQLQIYKEERGIPWDHNRYWYRVVDLEELIERRAYRIRKSLEKSNNLKYEPKDESTLILKTKDNCHEESVMGYVIGGGAVGVAGGGGWKAVSVM